MFIRWGDRRDCPAYGRWRRGDSSHLDSASVRVVNDLAVHV